MSDVIIKKQRKISNNLQVIQKFVNYQQGSPKQFWSRENALAKRLITNYGVNFLLWVQLPNSQKVNSLLWFSDKEGQSYLNAYLLEYKKFITDLSVKMEPVLLSNEKLGQDIQIIKQPKTLIEFLNYLKQ